MIAARLDRFFQGGRAGIQRVMRTRERGRRRPAAAGDGGCTLGDSTIHPARDVSNRAAEACRLSPASVRAEVEPAVSSGLTGELIRDLAAFEKLAGAWDELLLASDTPNSFFLSSSALVPFWKHHGAGRELTVVLVRDPEGRLAGAAPFYVQTVGHRLSRHRRLALLGSPESGSDYLDVIARRGMRRGVLEAAFACLRASHVRWDAVNLNYILEDSPTIPHLTQGACGCRTWLRIDPSSPCPHASLPATWDEYVAGLGAKTRRNIASRTRMLFQRYPDARFEMVTDESRVPDLLATMIGYKQQRYGHELDDEYRSWCDQALAALRNDRLRLLVLWLGNSPAFVAFSLALNGRIFGQGMAYRPDLAGLRVGTIGVAQSLRAAIEEGAVEFDMKRGEAEHKRHFATGQRQTVEVNAVRRSAWGAWVLFWEYNGLTRWFRRQTKVSYRKASRAARQAILAAAAHRPGLVPRRLLARARRGAAAEAAARSAAGAGAPDCAE
jgi:CelD/BcsL family acetyltransferase involved in cellulose biosynthesis